MDLHDERIVVTGGAGFLGRHVVAELHRAGCCDVVVPRSADFDLTRESHVRRLLRLHAPQVVIHLAAVVGGIGANRRHPGTFAYKNLVMGAHLVEHCRRAGVRKFLTAGTVCSYPCHTAVPFREDDLWAGYPEATNAPYGLAKKMLLVQLQAYRQEFGFNGVCLLLANLYGPGDNFDPKTSHVVPALARKCIEARDRGERTIQVWGTGQASRDLLYVEDAARAIRFALERYDAPEPVNVGSGQEIRIADLARLIATQTGFAGDIVFDPSQPDGQPRRVLDTSRARKFFGFEAATSLQTGLKRTIAWYEAARHSPAEVGP
jgi:GDP-L-fucose synthase